MGALLRRAYGVDSYQLSWPAGLPGGYFDVDAKVPPNTAEPEFEEMLRSMLMDRLGMKVHHETREIAGYELVAARTGARMRLAEQTASPPPADIPVGRIPLIKDRNGELQLPPGRSASLTIRLSAGRFRKSGRMQTMADLAEICTHEIGRPVVDRTGLAGVYDFDVDFARAPDDPREAQDDAATPFAIAVQAQLGLRLASREVPVDVIVIDRIDRKPAEN
jgi:uncharacterized protein (TIGR03435 family)